MEQVFRVKLKNGAYEYFTNEKEANAFEVDLKLKEQQEIERKRKEEDERKAREEKLAREKKIRESKLDELNNDFKAFRDKVEFYEKETGRKVIYGYDYSTKQYMITDTRNTFDFAYDFPLEQIVKAIRKA